MCESVSALESSARAKVSKSGKSLAARSKRKNGVVPAKAAQARAELDTCNTFVMVVEARATDLKNSWSRLQHQCMLLSLNICLYMMRLRC